MTYNEFKNTYKKTLKKYPNTSAILYTLENKTITETVTHYVKNGTQWKETDSKTQEITGTFYMNVIDSIYFFRNLGGAETVRQSYTKYGLIPDELISTSPTRTERTRRTYIFH